METRSAKRRKKLLPATTTTTQPRRTKPPRLDRADRISDLPDDVIHQILSHLPIKCIAQTSSLSRRWKNLWHSFPDLDFTTIDDNRNNSTKSALFSKPLLEPAVPSKHNRRARAHSAKDPSPADQVSALLEKRRVDVRLLRFRAFLSFTCLSGLIRHAIRRNVRDLDLEVSTSDYFNFPRVLVNSTTLRTLRLKSWHPGFRLPPLEIMKDGFKSLTVLSLSRPVLHDRPLLVDLFTHSSFPMLKKLHLVWCFGMRRLKVECRGLEDLTLESCLQLQDLEVHVERLERLRVSSCFDSYGVGNRVRVEAPRLGVLVWSYNAVTDECLLTGLGSLREAFVGFFRADPQDLGERKAESMWRFLKGISSCCSLTLESQCVEIISKSNRFASVSLCPFNKLKSLELSTGFHKHNNPGLASIFRSSPNVHTIIIKIISDQNAERQQWNKDLWESPSSGEERYWESQSQYLKPFLRNLKVVRIRGFMECANEVSLVKFLLKHGKVLQELLLSSSLSQPRDSLLREKIKSQIMGFSRASSNANIVFQ